MNNERLLKAAEIAPLLGMSRASLYQLAATGRIPFYAAGPGLSGVRFDLEEVKAILRRPHGADTKRCLPDNASEKS